MLKISGSTLQTKNMGAMGFKNFEGFNLALLVTPYSVSTSSDLEWVSDANVVAGV